MNEAEARDLLQRRFAVSRETMKKLDHFADLLRRANEGQNLVAAASLDQVWARHFLDSAQLLRFAPSPNARWVDLGSGAGFPGLVVALIHGGPVTLIEERRLRVEFLRSVAADLALSVEIIGQKVERTASRPFDVVSARAFAPLGRLLDLGTRFSTIKTLWILPKGRNAQSELEALESSWQGEFQLEESLTDAEARIIVARGVQRTGKRKRR
jgi:16S rRNA (guanine527-N7)-methyltransferase